VWVKPLFAAVASAAGLIASGCASDTPPAEEVREHFQRGLSGQGQLGPIDRGDEPFGDPRAGNPNAGPQ
jgi:cytochrome c556